jgi:hypothetical protein
LREIILFGANYLLFGENDYFLERIFFSRRELSFFGDKYLSSGGKYLFVD